MQCNLSLTCAAESVSGDEGFLLFSSTHFLSLQIWWPVLRLRQQLHWPQLIFLRHGSHVPHLLRFFLSFLCGFGAVQGGKQAPSGPQGPGRIEGLGSPYPASDSVSKEKEERVLSELQEKVELLSREGVEIFGTGTATTTLSSLKFGSHPAVRASVFNSGTSDNEDVSFWLWRPNGSRLDSLSLVCVSAGVQTCLSP